MKTNSFFNAIQIRDTIWKLLTWVAIGILTLFATIAASTYQGAKDGSEALRQNKNQDLRIDSICDRSSQHDFWLQKIQTEQILLKEEQSQNFEKLYDRIDDIYKILISQK